jgi:hypothetical protein
LAKANKKENEFVVLQLKQEAIQILHLKIERIQMNWIGL